MSGAIVDTLNVAFTAGSVVADTFGIRALLEFNRYGTATVAPLPTQNLKAYYIRRNRRDRNRMVNVFAGNGQLVYTIERKTQFSTVWSVLSTDRREVATVNAGLFNRCFDFHNKPEVQHRDLLAETGLTGIYRKFYLADGAAYEWSRSSGFLERIVNPGGGDEEIRQRVAKARLMRQFRFDYELVVDESGIDADVAIVTGFITMLCSWGLGNSTATRGPTYIPGNPGPNPAPRPLPMPTPAPGYPLLPPGGPLPGPMSDPNNGVELVIHSGSGTQNATTTVSLDDDNVFLVLDEADEHGNFMSNDELLREVERQLGV
ncbi:hypothetical protein B0I72DRAFT_137329 [Yarrowia lipolytica]|jgi:hypothetical protein|uniref:YALI0E08052p n=2 Tax=Yarrowia lipolytica TaxID=4952 RepID=Q6C6M9_YARLI|nr:YALI0E08052p [Yarrowia lipolytica CLIB122]AOW05109.1 hypothetical protein YALI1_E09769g [Yarrowia lipolytica]KAB8286083.1 hypothetical protein BKA91DRAFT_131913 [Yarrowia lipolytica]KAE8170151.1 hypothetical protein BKA90DRAFT_141393 [Yarrowia lipolytica]KAJ8056666.1 hypothetical protein LXG23DRAFT_53380 [Yarrowia lipolytica]RDW25470.1 hypothetical protein B0I71DRAFT_132566 [Yarrowia lipolytica]|eukprot:XP_503683.1 YALI0E08052p [Yarrowia lipolytica CLIB122]